MNRRAFFRSLAALTIVAATPLKFLPKRSEVWAFVHVNRNLSLDDFERRVLEPAIRKMAERIDNEVAHAVYG